jgi:hypothetical protein
MEIFCLSRQRERGLWGCCYFMVLHANDKVFNVSISTSYEPDANDSNIGPGVGCVSLFDTEILTTKAADTKTSPSSSSMKNVYV